MANLSEEQYEALREMIKICRETRQMMQSWRDEDRAKTIAKSYPSVEVAVNPKPFTSGSLISSLPSNKLSNPPDRAQKPRPSPPIILTTPSISPPDPPDRYIPMAEEGSRQEEVSPYHLPVFDGTSLDCWIMEVERFFRLGQYGDEEKLDIISLSLEEAALKWFKKHRREFTDWTCFKRKVRARFGMSKSSSPPEVLSEKKPIPEIDQNEDLRSETESIDLIVEHEVQDTTFSDLGTICEFVGEAKPMEDKKDIFVIESTYTKQLVETEAAILEATLIQNQEGEDSVKEDSMVEQIGLVPMLMQPFRFDHMYPSLERKLVTSLIINEEELLSNRKKKQKWSKSWRFKFKGKYERNILSGDKFFSAKESREDYIDEGDYAEEQRLAVITLLNSEEKLVEMSKGARFQILHDDELKLHSYQLLRAMFLQVQGKEKQKKYHKTWKFKYKIEFLLRMLLQAEQQTLLGERIIKCKMRMFHESRRLRQLVLADMKYQRSSRKKKHHCLELKEFSWVKEMGALCDLILAKRVWETGGVLIEHDKWNWLENCYKHDEVKLQVASNCLYTWLKLYLLHIEEKRDAHMLLLGTVVKWKHVKDHIYIMKSSLMHRWIQVELSEFTGTRIIKESPTYASGFDRIITRIVAFDGAYLLWLDSGITRICLSHGNLSFIEFHETNTWEEDLDSRDSNEEISVCKTAVGSFIHLLWLDVNSFCCMLAHGYNQNKFLSSRSSKTKPHGSYLAAVVDNEDHVADQVTCSNFEKMRKSKQNEEKAVTKAVFQWKEHPPDQDSIAKGSVLVLGLSLSVDQDVITKRSELSSLRTRMLSTREYCYRILWLISLVISIWFI